MNIIDAIKSGKRFKRVEWLNSDYYSANPKFLNIGTEDVLANDWEVESLPVTITANEFMNAYFKASQSEDLKHGRMDLCHLIMLELGL